MSRQSIKHPKPSRGTQIPYSQLGWSMLGGYDLGIQGVLPWPAKTGFWLLVSLPISSMQSPLNPKALKRVALRVLFRILVVNPTLSDLSQPLLNCSAESLPHTSGNTESNPNKP